MSRRNCLAALAGCAGMRSRAFAMGGSFLRLPDRFHSERVLNSGSPGPHRSAVIADLEGPGCVRRVWVAIRPQPMANRNTILRIFFDGESQPSVETPLGDFFGLCHGIPFYPLNSLYLAAQHQAGYNCYFPMPFARSARFEIENGPEPSPGFYYHIDWHRYAPGSLKEDMRFHAAWRREFPARAFGEEFLILDAAGRGRLMGFVYGVRLYDESARWSHGGAENIYLDGEAAGEEGVEPGYIRGSGGEDTFGAAYGGVLHQPETYLYQGLPYYVHEDIGKAKAAHRVVGYRFYEQDAIPFERSVHFRFGCVANDICSTAYWYQAEPHRPFVKMPPWSQMLPGIELERGVVDLLRQSGSSEAGAALASPRDGEWWLCGPFEDQQGEAMKRPLPPEAGANPDPQARYDGGFGPRSPWRFASPARPDQHMARWVRRWAFHGFVDFTHVFRPWEPGVATAAPAAACALTTLHVDRDTPATLYFAWDDRMLVRLNDDAPLDLGSQPAFRQRALPVRLRKGDNRLLVKLNNAKGTTWGGWCFAFTAMLPDGSAVVPRV